MLHSKKLTTSLLLSIFLSLCLMGGNYIFSSNQTSALEMPNNDFPVWTGWLSSAPPAGGWGVVGTEGEIIEGGMDIESKYLTSGYWSSIGRNERMAVFQNLYRQILKSVGIRVGAWGTPENNFEDMMTEEAPELMTSQRDALGAMFTICTMLGVSSSECPVSGSLKDGTIKIDYNKFDKSAFRPSHPTYSMHLYWFLSLVQYWEPDENDIDNFAIIPASQFNLTAENKFALMGVHNNTGIQDVVYGKGGTVLTTNSRGDYFVFYKIGTQQQEVQFAIRVQCWNLNGQLGELPPPPPILIDNDPNPQSFINDIPDHTHTAKPGEIVEFDHKITRPNENTNDKFPADWKIIEERTPTSLVTSLASVPLCAIPQGNNQIITDADGAWNSSNELVNVSTANGYNIANNSATGCTNIKFKVPDDAKDGDKWCQKISYTSRGDASYTDEAKKVCVVASSDKPPDPPDPPVCPPPLYPVKEPYECTPSHGRTVGYTHSINLTTQDSSLLSTDWRTQNSEKNDQSINNTTWAKPGDSVQFRHTLQPGALGVHYSNTTHPRDGTSINYSEERTVPIPREVTCDISAYIAFGSGNNPNYVNNSNYAFGDSIAKCGAKTGESAEQIWYSPSVNTYQCSSGAYTTPYKSPGYQVPGFYNPNSSNTKGGCTSIRNSNLGQTIQQGMVYGSTLEAESVYDDHIHHTVCGKYSCTDYRHGHYIYKVTNSGSESRYAQVKIPFNYNLTPRLTTTTPSPDAQVVFAGEDVAINTLVNVNTQMNSLVNGAAPYATMSKPSVYEIVTWVATPESSKPTLFADNNPAAPGRVNGSMVTKPVEGDSCRFWYNSYSSYRACQTLYYQDDTWNKNGTLGGNTDNLWSGTITVDDAPVGSKFCVALSVWPDSSHNRTSTGSTNVTDATNLREAMQGSEGYGDVTGSWHHAAPHCFDIAKKPNLQFWNQGVVTEGSITTSTSLKAIGFAPGTLVVRNDNNPRIVLGTTIARGSDAEGPIEKISGNKISNGYMDDTIAGSRQLYGSWSEYSTILIGNNSYSNGFASGAAFGYQLNNGGTYAKPGGFQTTLDGTSPCTFTKMSITNKNCETSVGQSTISAASFRDVTLTRLLARYAAPVDAKQLTSSSVTPSSLATGKYKSTQNLTINASTIPAGRTISIYTSGSVTITGNLNYQNTSYSNITSLPQLLIFAGDIYIEENVTNVDAWLVAGKTGTGTGVVDTCKGKTIGKDGINLYDCNQKLSVNGPVYATKLITNRTAGAGPGMDSIDPAEVFNLRPDTYMWVYSQTQNYAQAVTTYIKELPPRY